MLIGNAQGVAVIPLDPGLANRRDYEATSSDRAVSGTDVDSGTGGLAEIVAGSSFVVPVKASGVGMTTGTGVGVDSGAGGGGSGGGSGAGVGATSVNGSGLAGVGSGSGGNTGVGGGGGSDSVSGLSTMTGGGRLSGITGA